MPKPQNFYQENLKKFQAELAVKKKQLAVSSTVRLLVFLALCVLIYFLWGNWQFVAISVVVGIAAFIFLVSRHSDLRYKADFLKQLLALNEVELQVLDRKFKHLPNGEKYNDPQHPYSLDIDLFGHGSFFQYLNRTALADGTDYLAALLTENSIENIEPKQQAIGDLGERAKWRQDFLATAALVKTDYSGAQILDWLRKYQTIIPKVMRWVPLAFSIVSVVLLAASFFEIISGKLVLAWFFIGLGVVGAWVKKVNMLSQNAGNAQSTFQQYYKLLLLLENEDFSAEFLEAQINKIKPETGDKASGTFAQFSKRLNALDQRNNMIVAVFMNGFFLADLRNAYRIEQWISQHANEVGQWFAVIAFFDAYISLGNFRFNHPAYTFPKLVDEDLVFEAKQAAHPLLDPTKAVANDFIINSEEFFIITGANMAGKSTFLRTVGLQLVMANVGLPINATEVKYAPIKLITSMRTTDSLTDEASYFFSELSRLQYIVNAIKTDRYLIVLDEILKGTNSTDKAIGSRKFIEKLVRSHSTGIIATHDLSLCEAANELDAVKNYYFDAEIINDELYFDYTFKKGICQNMNASFLLRKMNIIDN
ncbi:MAG: DNA mismatch repair protein MutS [Leeuwenhoekiella sp.]